MDLSLLQSITSASDDPSSRVDQKGSAAFRDADFLAIILAELSNQDPFEPMETAKLVENMQKMQELANTRFDRFRNDMQWAQELVGKSATVTQAALSAEEEQVLRDRGLNPDVGYGFVDGVVEGYRVVGENVWVTVDNKDYQLDKVQKIAPADRLNEFTGLADQLLGRFVSYRADTNGENGAGRVTDVQWTDSGEVFLSIGTSFVPYTNITSIGE